MTGNTFLLSSLSEDLHPALEFSAGRSKKDTLLQQKRRYRFFSVAKQLCRSLFLLSLELKVAPAKFVMPQSNFF